MNLTGVLISSIKAGGYLAIDAVYIVARQGAEITLWVVPGNTLPLTQTGTRTLPLRFQEQSIFTYTYKKFPKWQENCLQLRSDLKEFFGVEDSHMWYPVDRNPLGSGGKNEVV